MQKQTLVKQALIALCCLLVFGFLSTTPGNAAKLSDLIKRTPQLYLPTQILPGKNAFFTLKGKPGKQVKLMLSSQSQGATLPNGVSLRIGKVVASETSVIPASGVVEIPIKIPDAVANAMDKQFVEAIVWSNPDQSDAEPVEIIDSNGLVSTNNTVLIGSEPDPGSVMVMPGDQGMTNMLRSLNTFNAVNDDERKKQLIDNGTINRNRQIDRNLVPTTP